MLLNKKKHHYIYQNLAAASQDNLLFFYVPSQYEFQFLGLWFDVVMGIFHPSLTFKVKSGDFDVNK